MSERIQKNKNKNTKKFKGKELYKYTLQQCLRLFVKENIIVTTDDEKLFVTVNRTK